MFYGLLAVAGIESIVFLWVDGTIKVLHFQEQLISAFYFKISKNVYFH